MQLQLINRNPDLNQLHVEGYDIIVSDGYLLVRQIPYVTKTKQVRYGTLVCILAFSTPTKLTPPQDHTIYFCGDMPCHADGTPLNSIINSSQTQQLTHNILVNHYFSSKPLTGKYPNYYEKIRTYCEILSAQARIIDNNVTTKPKRLNHDEYNQ